LGLRLDRSIFLASCASIVGACGGATVMTDVTTETGAGGADGGAAATCSVSGLQDPDFATSTAWTPIRGVTLSPGSATFDTATMCDHGGIAQTLSTPPLTCARPLVLTLGVSLEDEDKLSFVAGVNGGWSSPVIPLGAQTLQICLGARVFGGAADLFLGMGNNLGLCPPQLSGGPSLSIEHVSIGADVTGACPLPGTVPNGDFERGTDRWTLHSVQGTAEIAPGLGEAGSLGARLATDRLCEGPFISGTISLPTSAMMPNPALRIWSKGTRNAVASVRIGSPVHAFYTGATYLPGTDQAVVTNVCIPRWAQGTVQPLALAFVETAFNQVCKTDNARDFAFDGLSFVSEPACATDANVFDPGFEQVAVASGAASFWALDRYDDDLASRVELETDGTSAHTGNVAAVLSTSTPCPRVSLSGGVTVPSPAGTQGPALRFWYQTSASTHTGLTVSLSALAAPVPLPATSTWTQVTACLDPHLASRPDLLSFALASITGGGTCADTFPTETVALDDIELAIDPSCPAM
jgi:hypothetical protein